MAVNPPPSTPVERSLVIPPPVYGWNTKDPLSAMDPLYAPELVNFFPNAGTVDLRNGYLQYATGVGSGDVRDIYQFIDTAGSRYFVATGNDAKAYEITPGGAGTNITGALTPFPARNYFATYKNRMWIKSSNASHDVYYWTGSGNVTAAAFTGPSGDDKALGYIAPYKGRLYFAGNDASIWYSDFGAVTGALTQYDFSGFFESGGKVAFIGTFSPYSSNSLQSYFLVISSGGDALIFQGDYPGSSTWALTSRYYIGAPVGGFSFFRFYNDVLVITGSGLVSMLAVVQGAVGEDQFLSNNIQSVWKGFIEGVIAAGTLNLISGCFYPLGNYILISIYIAANTYYQLVMNATTKAWTLFKGQNGVAFCVFNNNLYFGADGSGASGGKVAKADTGYFDDDLANAGTPKSRELLVRHAFNSMGSPTVRKQFTRATPTVYQSENLSITINGDVDYTNTVSTSTETDTSKGTSYQLYQPTCSISADSGNALSVRIDGTCTTKRFSLQATKVTWNEGTAV